MTTQKALNGAAPALRLDAVTAGYQDVQVLRDVSLSVGRSRVVALLGPNGAGKTTLLRYASGLIGSRTGRLEVAGGDVTGWAPAKVAKAGVCHIPEGRGVYPSLTVRENMALFSPRISAAELVERSVAAFPALRTKLGQVAGTLSGGEQQMLALSRAYTGNPLVVLLDEVSMGLAPKVVDEIFTSVSSLREKGVALLLVEQYVDRALDLADDVYVLSGGAVKAHGPAREFTRERIVASYLGGGT